MSFVLLSIVFVITGTGSLFTVKNVDEFVDNTYILITIFVGCCKSLNVLLYRERIISLMNVFLEEPCATSTNEETEIQMIYDARLRRNAFRYTALIESSIGMTIFNSILTNFKHGRLTYRAWIPYDYTTAIVYSLTFASQLVYVLMQSLVHIATDVLFVGVLMQVCCQFEILLSRLNNVQANSDVTLRRIVRHHNYIYQLAAMINDTLNLIIFSQYFGSFLVLCLSLIQLLKADIFSTEFLATIFYLTTILLQSFLYCWYGNEVKLKSINLADMMFQIDWTEFDASAKKILLIAMNRTQSPIELESAHVMTVNIDFFMTLLKSSYSVYNLLQSNRK
ncbi:odorant receptor 94b-like [Xylocopa sonorina]|uniref:odorant receptor 94b-like n=1 Tax=Xylocopa sonorina TaxID=1818115 RepID=UPI00403AD902